MTFTCAGIAIALIGFSRIFLSLHYLSDVLAGYAIAAVWLWIGWRMTPRTS
jgi:undecaprenyl-diphosphatase